MRLLAILAFVGFLIVACSDSGDDSGGTTGGSGDTQAAAATADTSTATTDDSDQQDDSTTTTTPASTSTVSTASEVWMDAYTFNCSSNWTNRDGPLGLAAYSGSGSCNKGFPGAPGTYQLILSAVTEFDGKSPYKVSINGTTIKEGAYPLSSPLGCDCPIDSWRSVCPDRGQNIDLGTHTLNTGDTIGFWGDDVYPCGEHGSYTKWYGIKAIKK